MNIEEFKSKFDEEFLKLYNSNFREDSNMVTFNVVNAPGISGNNDFVGRIGYTALSLKTIINILKPKTFLEIGTYQGHTTNVVCKSIKDIHGDAHVDTFDIIVGGVGHTVFQFNDSSINSHLWMPHHTSYDDWKYTNDGIVHKEFRNLTNEEIFNKNLNYLNTIKPDGGYDMIFIDGDHSFEGVEWDYKYALEVISDNGAIVFDDRLGHKKVTDFFETVSGYEKWDFLDWNYEHAHKYNYIQNFGIVFMK